MMFNRGFDGFGRCLEYGSDLMRSGWGFAMMGGMVLVAAIVIAVIVVLVRKARRNNNTYSEASELLNARFVKGEITEEEYAKMKKVLGSK